MKPLLGYGLSSRPQPLQPLICTSFLTGRTLHMQWRSPCMSLLSYKIWAHIICQGKEGAVPCVPGSDACAPCSCSAAGRPGHPKQREHCLAGEGTALPGGGTALQRESSALPVPQHLLMSRALPCPHRLLSNPAVLAQPQASGGSAASLTGEPRSYPASSATPWSRQSCWSCCRGRR